jgi:glycosyltransferase involved in cell wall biosynthesis
MTSLPRFSVIIPTYNRASLVAGAVESVLAQTYTDLEIIVMDDGSTDSTAEVVRHFESEHRGRIRYYWQENQGKSVALNHALGLARGEFIAFLDSDDRWLPAKLEWQLRALQEFGEQHPCFTDARYINNQNLQTTAFAFAGREYKGELGLISDPTVLFLGTGRSGVYIQTLILQKTLAGRVGDFDPKLRIGNDTDYLFRLGLLTRFCFVNKPLVEIDRTANRKDGLIEQMARDEYLRLQEREHLYHKWLDLTRDLQNNLRTQVLGRLAETHNEWANWHLANHEYGKARKSMSRAVATQFTARTVFKLALTTVAGPIARREYLKRDAERAKHRMTT